MDTIFNYIFNILNNKQMKTKTKKDFFTHILKASEIYNDDLKKNLNLIYEENESFKSDLINILNNQDLTDKEKIKNIKLCFFINKHY